jgi:hypothetical protein
MKMHGVRVCAAALGAEHVARLSMMLGNKYRLLLPSSPSPALVPPPLSDVEAVSVAGAGAAAKAKAAKTASKKGAQDAASRTLLLRPLAAPVVFASVSSASASLPPGPSSATQSPTVASTGAVAAPEGEATGPTSAGDGGLESGDKGGADAGAGEIVALAPCYSSATLASQKDLALLQNAGVAPRDVAMWLARMHAAAAATPNPVAAAAAGAPPLQPLSPTRAADVARQIVRLERRRKVVTQRRARQRLLTALHRAGTRL